MTAELLCLQLLIERQQSLIICMHLPVDFSPCIHCLTNQALNQPAEHELHAPPLLGMLRSPSTASSAHLELPPPEGVDGTGKWVDEQLAWLFIGEVKDIPHTRGIPAIPLLHPARLMLAPPPVPALISTQCCCSKLLCLSAFRPSGAWEGHCRHTLSKQLPGVWEGLMSRRALTSCSTA